MALNHLQWHLETTDSLAYTMTGFQSHSSTQDAMLRIYEDIYQNAITTELRIIASVDIYKAFDSVAHHTILDNLLDTAPGSRMYIISRPF